MNKRMLKKRDKQLTISFFLAMKKKFPKLFEETLFSDDLTPGYRARFAKKRIYRKRNW